MVEKIEKVHNGGDVRQICVCEEDCEDGEGTYKDANSDCGQQYLWNIDAWVGEFLGKVGNGIEAGESPINATDSNKEGNPIRPA